MKTAVIATLVSAVLAAPQAVTSAIAPTASTPAGCSTSYDGQFQLVVEAIGSSSKSKRDSTPLEVTLSNSILTDAQKRTGYIASNYQFQFDDPAQAGAIYTAGWSICNNGSLALGGSAIFYQCLSGSFYNLYDRSWAAQCSPIYLVALGGTPVVAQSASVASDGQVAAATTASVLCQIGDGQIQKNTCVTTATAAVQQQSDGQITAAKATITQISDGQIQAPATTTSAAKTTSSAVGATVGVATDGQVTAGTSKAASTNGTVAASTRTPTAASSAAASTSSTIAASSGGAAEFGANSLFALAAGALAILAL